MRLKVLRLITAVALLPVSTAFVVGPSLPDNATARFKTTATIVSSSSDNDDVNPNGVPYGTGRPIPRSNVPFPAYSIHAPTPM